jgi:hydroxyacyl-ACP dehydratase HTD2-like protein with hotdog domain
MSVQSDGSAPAMQPGRALISEIAVQPNEIDLFMFSAATWLTHRIHYDRDYARKEGYADLVVHGPLQGAYLSQMLADFAWRHDGQLVSMEYRHHQPAYCRDTLTCTARVRSTTRRANVLVLAVDVEIVNGTGLTVTSGSAVIHLGNITGLPELAGSPQP